MIKVIYYLSLFSSAFWLFGLFAGVNSGIEIVIGFLIISLTVAIASSPRDSYVKLLIRNSVRFIIKKYKAHKNKLIKNLDE